MDDEPGNNSPKNVARMPALNFMRRNGQTESVNTIPEGNSPATDVALMNILGYNPGEAFSGRTWLEALGAGIQPDDDDLCLRCSFITIDSSGRILKSSSEVTSAQSQEIIGLLNQRFASKRLRFYSGTGYRNLLIIKNCRAKLTVPPTHTILGKDVSRLAVTSDDADLQCCLNDIMVQSRQYLNISTHGTNGISLWAPGHKLLIDYKIEGAVVTGVDLVKGIGKAFGMEVVKVEGATGNIDTDYSAKLQAALKALSFHDFVMLHIEAPDEASHTLNPQLKAEVLETIDRLILQPIIESDIEMEVRVQSDHATSSITGQHLDVPIEVVKYSVNR
ncbi:MAG: hypothetical protein K2K76_06420, partial [Muribaculaceae bacterium]|nr:hypothetical protein [Muribaculaceae bacterium]